MVFIGGTFIVVIVYNRYEKHIKLTRYKLKIYPIGLNFEYANVYEIMNGVGHNPPIIEINEKV